MTILSKGPEVNTSSVAIAAAAGSGMWGVSAFGPRPVFAPEGLGGGGGEGGGEGGGDAAAQAAAAAAATKLDGSGADNPAAKDTTEGGGGSAADVSTGKWFDAVANDDNKKLLTTKGWADKTLDDVLTSYREAETQLGKVLTLPPEGATQEQKDAFYAKLGRPENPAGYEFPAIEGLPASLPYSAESDEAFKSWAHKAGLTKEQAVAIRGEYVAQQVAQAQAIETQYREEVTAAVEGLAKVWGPAESEQHRRNAADANTAIRNLGGTDLVNELKAKGALGPNGEVLAPLLADVLAKVGRAMFAEDKGHGIHDSMPAKNPFDLQNQDYAEQSRLVKLGKSDPNMARVVGQMMRNAKQDPKKDYNLDW